MDWEVVVTPTFEDWFMALSESEQKDILAMIEVLVLKVAQHAFSKHLQAKDEKSIHND